MQKWLGLLVPLYLSACVSATRQTDAWLEDPQPGPSQVQIEAPFLDQSGGHCGPATLAMAMASLSRPVPVSELAREIYSDDQHGSLQADMMGASRRRGLMAVAIEGLPALVRELRHGHAVIVFENLSVSWWPQWHYALAVGYDRTAGDIILHSGHEAFKHWSMKKFERSWELADRWGLVVLRPGDVAQAAGELANVGAAAALEQLGMFDEAETSYRGILAVWPESLSALVGLGNIAYQRNDLEGAVRELRRATSLHPQAAFAWHNLALAEAAAHRMADARTSARRALELVSDPQKSLYAADFRDRIESP